MAYTQIIIDTNSYLRLAQNIHPLLGIPFGAPEYALYILPEVIEELRNSPRLQTKFDWASGSEWLENREKTFRLNKKVKREIEQTYEYMWAYVKEDVIPLGGKSPSPADTRMVATAAVLEIEVVTDDQPMIELAEMYGVPHLTSLELMKRMQEWDHITSDQIERVVSQWRYDRDTPYKSWDKEYRTLFRQEPPS